MSEKAKHTSGPWEVLTPEKPLEGFEHAVTNRAGAALAWVLPHRDEEGAANARLIAAAPELLAALKGFLHADPDVFAAELAAARAAIAKAEGRA